MDDDPQRGVPPWQPGGEQTPVPDWSQPAESGAGAAPPSQYPFANPPAGEPGPTSGGFPPAYPGAPAPPSGYGTYPGAPYPPPGYQQPGYPGQAGPPSQGWAPPSYPVQPGYGWPAAPSTPYGYPPGALPPAPRRGLGAGAIIGIVALVLVVCIAATVGALVAFSPSHSSVFSNTTSGQPTAGATPTGQSAAGAYRYDFKDSLNGTSNQGWSNDNYCFFRGGAYHVDPGSQYSGIYCAAPAGSFSDFDLHVTLSETAGPLDYGYGLAFRHSGSGNFYVFVVYSNGQASFDKFASGHITHLSNYSQLGNFTRGMNVQNTIRVVAHGASFTFYVNGVKVGQETDATYTAGTVGLFSGDNNLDAAFTNFEVQGNP